MLRRGDFLKIIHLYSPSNTVAEISTECATIHVNVKDVWSNTTTSSTASDTSNTSVLMNLESSNTGYQGKFFVIFYLSVFKKYQKMPNFKILRAFCISQFFSLHYVEKLL